MIELKEMSLSFKEHQLFDDSNIIIYDQCITVITGKSGCGKSTLLYEMANFTHYSTTKYYLDGKEDVPDYHQIGFVFQDCHLFNDLTVYDNIYLYSEFGCNTYDENRVLMLMDEMNLNIDLNEYVKNLSGGQKQRLLILCCMVKDPEYIFLDEPTAYLDAANKKDLLDLFVLLCDKYHKTLVIVTHDLDILDIADVHYHIQDKKIILKKEKKKESIKELKKKKRNYPLHFYKKAIKKNKVHQKRQVFLTVIMAIVFYMSCFQSYYLKALDQISSEMTFNEIRISYDPGGNSYDVTGKAVPQMLVNSLNNHNLIKSVSPFYEWNVKTSPKTNIVIQPYHKDFKGNKQSTLIINQKTYQEPIYISSSLYELIKNTDITGIMSICKNNQLEYVDLLFEIKNVNILDQKNINRYTHTTENIIYIPEKMCQNIIHDFIDNYTYQSNVYLLELYSYLDISQIEDFIQKNDPDIHIYNPVSDSILNQTASFSQKMMIKFVGYIMIIYLFSIILLGIFDIMSSRFDYSLLMVNGIKKRECLNLIFVQKLKYVIYSNIFCELFILSVFYIQYQLISIDIIKNSLFVLLLNDMLMILIPCLSFILMFLNRSAGDMLKS